MGSKKVQGNYPRRVTVEEVFFHFDLKEWLGPCPRARENVGPSRQRRQHVQRHRLLKDLGCLRAENLYMIGAVCVGRWI